MGEIWKDIKNYEGYYQVSNFGNVRSVRRTVNCRNGKRTVYERFMKPNEMPLGYKQVGLSKECSTTRFFVHRLVAMAFIRNPNNFSCINHKDGNPANNCADNLEWCDHKYNSNYHLCKQKQSEFMKSRYADLSTLHKNIPHPRPVCQLGLDGKLIRVFNVLRDVQAEGFSIRNVRNCADCLGGKWNKPTKHGFSKTHRGYRWVWLEDYRKGVR